MDASNLYQYGRYAASLIASVSDDTTPPEPSFEINWDTLYDFAIEQNISALILPAIKKLNIPAEVFEKFDKDKYQKMAREARMCIEAQNVFDALSQNDIDYIKMKGIVIKDFYPLSYMRTFGDIDLYVGEIDRGQVKSVMENLGYKAEHSNESHDGYEKGRFSFEMHSSILPKHYRDILSKPFEHSENDCADPHSFVLEKNYFYLHLITHLYKHFAFGGCGIRLYCDLYFFEKAHPDLDFDFIEATLKKYNFDEFYTHTKKLLEIFFCGGESDERYDLIMDYIFANGVQGDQDLMRMHENHRLRFIDKVQFIAHNWFGYEILSLKYPTLKKAPVLLPVFWVVRLVDPLFRNRKVVKARAEDLKIMNSKKFKDAKTARELVGIK
ncbi:MAG: nucleotidyltransferase family protein [Eubacteriales bacterium]|nr:nucleotidyltransferase family protein [Eubacteriales bacterium]